MNTQLKFHVVDAIRLFWGKFLKTVNFFFFYTRFKVLWIFVYPGSPTKNFFLWKTLKERIKRTS